MLLKLIFETWLLITLIKFCKVRLKLFIVCFRCKLNYKEELRNIKKSYFVADLEKLSEFMKAGELSKRQVQDIVIFTNRYNKSTNYKIKINTYLISLGNFDTYRCENLNIETILSLYNKIRK